MTLRDEWDRCLPFLLPALDLDPTDTPEDIWAGILAGEYQFWPGMACAGVGQIVRHARVTDFHVWLAGGDLEDLQQMERSVEAFARAAGCNRITIRGRRGWLRALKGYREQYTAMAKEL